MIKANVLCGLLAILGIASASGEEFPLAFRTIPAQDVRSFPGDYGIYGQLRLSKPETLKKEPRAVSHHALYGECGATPGGAGFLYRLDESRGNGHGYDRLIVDMNQNGDLTDDPVVQRAVLSTERPMVSNQMLFGPIPAPADKMIAGGRPVYFAQVYIFNQQLLSAGQTGRNIMFGQVMLRAGWYLDTTVVLNGLKEKVGVFDGNSNLRLGDIAEAQTYTNRGERTWYFASGDNLLVDADNSGVFENNVFQSESCPFGPILYLGGKAYKVALTPDCKALRVELWTEALADVALQPRGDQVHNLTLAWKQPDGQWQLIRPEVAGGKVRVPPGDYRLYACTLLGKAAGQDQVMVSGTQRNPQTPVHLAAGKGNRLECGAPLEIKVTAAKVRPVSRSMSMDDAREANSEPTLRIDANVVGAGGEIYSTFQKGEDFQARPPRPSFTIVGPGGRTVAKGNLEFG